MELCDSLLRWILLFARRECGTVGFVVVPDHPDFCAEQVHYHVGICEQAELLEVIDQTVHDYPYRRYGIRNLTLKGHQFLAQKPSKQIGFLLS